MSVSSVLELFQMTAAATQKDAIVNIIMGQLEGAMASSLDVDTSSITTSGQTLQLPYDDSNDLSERGALHNLRFVLTSGATDAFTLEHPANQHLFFVQNDTAVTVTIDCSAQVATAPTLTAGSLGMFYCDGTDVIDMLANLSASVTTQTVDYTVHFSDSSGPTADLLLAKFIVPRDLTFPSNLVGSAGTCETAPATAWDILVQDDGVTFATITVNTDGSITFTTTGSHTVAADSILTFITDSTVYSCDDIFLSITGSSDLT